MLRVILLVVAFLGLTSSAFAAQASLFGDLFGKPSVSKASLTSMAPRRVKSIEGPISITIDISTQEMTVASADGRNIYTFDVSTGRKGYSTPTGSFKPIRM